MQIQRIQTLWLILAAICAAVSFAYPWLLLPDFTLYIKHNAAMVICASLAALLPIIGIFLYRNLKRQKTVSLLAAWFGVFTIVTAILLPIAGKINADDVQMCILGPILMCVSCIFDSLAIKGITRDAKLLRDADRLR